MCAADFGLDGNIKINTQEAIKGLTSILSLLNAIEKSVTSVSTKLKSLGEVTRLNRDILKEQRAGLAVQSQQAKLDREQVKVRQENAKLSGIEAKNALIGQRISANAVRVAKAQAVANAKVPFDTSLLSPAISRHAESISKLKGYDSTTAMQLAQDRAANINSQRSLNMLTASTNRNFANAELAAQKSVTREKEKQLRLQEQQRASQGRFLDGLFSVKNALMLITASYMAQFVQGLIDVSNRIVAVDVRFKALAPSIGMAKDEMDWIYKKAKDLRQPILDAAEGYSKFYAAAKNTLSKDQMRNVYDSLLQASTVMHIMPHQFKLVSLAVEQMASKGTISMEELRRQLGEHIPGAFGIAARAMGKSEQEFNKMVKDGKVFASEFLPKFAKQLKEELGSGLSVALQSSQSKIINMQNAIMELQKQLSEEGFADAIGNVADTITSIVQGDNFKKMVADLGVILRMLSKDILPILKTIFLLINLFLGYKIMIWLKALPTLLASIRLGVVGISTAVGGVWGIIGAIIITALIMIAEKYLPQILNQATHTFGDIRWEIDLLILRANKLKEALKDAFKQDSLKADIRSGASIKPFLSDTLNPFKGGIAGSLSRWAINSITNNITVNTQGNPSNIANAIVGGFNQMVDNSVKALKLPHN